MGGWGGEVECGGLRLKDSGLLGCRVFGELGYLGYYCQAARSGPDWAQG